MDHYSGLIRKEVLHATQSPTHFPAVNIYPQEFLAEGESLRTSRGIEVQIKIDSKLHDTPQQGVLQHKSHVVVDTKDANVYVNLVATLAEFLQEIAMLPKLCYESFQMCINGIRFIH